MINKELKRINDEAMASVAKETTNINEITQKIDNGTSVTTGNNTVCYAKSVADASKKFDQELFEKIWNGYKVIIIRDEYERGIFNACHFDNVIRYRGTAAPITDPLFAHYLCNDNEWIVSIATPFLVNSGVNIIDLAKRCPDFTEKFKKRIQAQRWSNSNDRL